jgi:hypothetical protein
MRWSRHAAVTYFLKRYFGWYLWLGVYTTAIGGLIGLLCFSVPFLPFLVIFFFSVYPPALVFAAPLNLVMLPVAFHRLRANPRRRMWLRLTGIVGGFFSPILPGVLAWCAWNPVGSFPVLFACRTAEPFLDRMESMTGLLIVGSIAGFFCGGLFDKHGDRGSIFDVNEALRSLRESELPPRPAARNPRRS